MTPSSGRASSVQLVSLNIGARERLRRRSFSGTTGIFKHPVDRATVHELGLETDAIVNTRHHGGPDQAVYLYRQEDYDWWSSQLDRPVDPGTFGENLTVSGLPSPAAVIGSRFAFDTVVLEVTAPRIPCNTLAARMGDPGFLKQFIRAERPGVYFRVVSGGTIAPGETVTITPYTGPAVTTVELFRASYRKLGAAEIRRFLAVPIDVRTRRDLERKLKRL